VVLTYILIIRYVTYMNRLPFLYTIIFLIASIVVLFYFFSENTFFTPSGISFPIQVFAATTCHCTIDGPSCVGQGGTPVRQVEPAPAGGIL